ncbi:MAG: hypothetical protein LAP61_29375 [Acidobacteriia bacterium]|nr:hypothetical protein [Terriglobia bacterium]
MIESRPNTPGVKSKLQQLGLDPANIIHWTENGIEHYYPHEILHRKFGEFTELSIVGDDVAANGIVIRKKELAEYIVDNLNGSEPLHDELRSKLFDRLDRLLQ